MNRNIPRRAVASTAEYSDITGMSNLTINAILSQLLDYELPLLSDEPHQQEAGPVTCVGCGCTDDRACIDEQGYACYWLKDNRRTGMGVCSCCPEFLSHPCTEDFD